MPKPPMVDLDVLPKQDVTVPYSGLTQDVLMGGAPAPQPAQAPVAPPPTGLSIADMAAPRRTPQTFEEQARVAQAERMNPEQAQMAQMAAERQAQNLMGSIPGLSFEEAMMMLGARVRVPSGKNPARPVAEGALSDAVGTPDEPGYLQRQREAVEAGGQAEVAQQEQLSEVLARQGLRNSLELAVETDRQAKEADVVQQRVETLDRAHKAVRQATQRLQNQPDVDSNRLWRNASNRDRALFAIGGLLGRGIFGPLFGRFADLEGAIDDDVADQIAGIEKRKSEVAGAIDEVNAADVAMRDILTATGSAQAAREGLKLARLEQQQAEYVQRAMELGIPMTEAHVQQTLAEFDEAKSRTQRGLELALARTPQTIGGGTRSALTPEQQKLVMEAMKQRGEITKAGFEQQGRMDLEMLKQQAKGPDDQLKLLRGEGGVYRESAALSDKIAEEQSIVTDVEDLKREYKDGIPGVGFLYDAESAISSFKANVGLEKQDRARLFRKKIENLVERALRAATGANAPEPEVEKYVDLIMEGYDEYNGEQKVWQNLDAFVSPIKNKIDVQMRGRSPEAQQYLQQNLATPQRDPQYYGRAPVRDVVTPK